MELEENTKYTLLDDEKQSEVRGLKMVHNGRICLWYVGVGDTCLAGDDVDVNDVDV